MKIRVIIYSSQDGGFWAEVPGLPGCYGEGETLDEVKRDITEAVESILQREERRSDSSDTKEPYQVCEIEV
jgi:predicted RNase H-like HicB family nuclease